MILIIGGAYQGKLAYAKERYGIIEEDIFFCKEGDLEIDYSKKVIYGLEKRILELVKQNIPYEAMRESDLEKWSDKIVICEDNSCGVVPIDVQLRKYREAQGRTLAYLSQNASEVIRMFCGLGSQIK